MTMQRARTTAFVAFFVVLSLGVWTIALVVAPKDRFVAYSVAILMTAIFVGMILNLLGVLPERRNTKP